MRPKQNTLKGARKRMNKLPGLEIERARALAPLIAQRGR